MKTPLSLFVLGLLSLCPIPAAAQQPAETTSYPARSVKVVVPYAPRGGGGHHRAPSRAKTVGADRLTVLRGKSARRRWHHRHGGRGARPSRRLHHPGHEPGFCRAARGQVEGAL